MMTVATVPACPTTAGDHPRHTICAEKLLWPSESYLQDIAIYAPLRAGKVQPAVDQMVQNMNAKQRAVKCAGSWDMAWPRTGLADHTASATFAATQSELAPFAAHRRAMMDPLPGTDAVEGMSEDVVAEWQSDLSDRSGDRGGSCGGSQ